MSNWQRIRTTEEIAKRMLNEEKIIVDLELAIKREQFRKIQEAKNEL